MTREEFRLMIQHELTLAEQELGNRENVLDLRAGRAPYDVVNDLGIFCTSDIDDAYDFVNGAEEWYVDVYENFYGENCAEYIGRSVGSWM